MDKDVGNLNYYYIYNATLNENNNSIFNSTGTICYSIHFLYNTSFGIETALPEWEALTITLVLSIVILGTIFGNILVILGVFTYKPLRIVQNFYIVSLAAADLAVAVSVMPLNMAYMTFGRWLWGKHLCKMWLTCDIMSCTSSILNLCAIALDRYYAITDPINYANKRTLNRVVIQIMGIWTLSMIISSPPLLGWNDWPEEFTGDTPCQLTAEPGYVVYSSLGSFFIPLIIMTIVYIKIYIAIKERLRKHAILTRVQNERPLIVADGREESEEIKEESDKESDSSETIKERQKHVFMDIKRNLFVPFLLLRDPASRQVIETNVDRVKSNISLGGFGSVKRVRSLKKRGQKNGQQLLASVDSRGAVVNQFIEQKQKISLSKEKRAARTLGIIMGVFVICWLPFFLMYLSLPFCPWCCPSNRLINLITWLGYANSTVNPIIYTIFNLDFRKAFKKLLGIK